MDHVFRGDGDRMPPVGRFASVTGTIVEMAPTKMRRQVNGCTIFVTLEDENGGTVNFIMGPDVYVVDFVTLSVGMKAAFWYRTDAPMPLIYPPQYRAAVAAQVNGSRMINVDHYNDALVNEAQTLQLHIDGSVNLRTVNNQYFQASPAGQELVVIYESSTRSIPAQTTPKEIIVLCGEA
ncbi:MAG: hypothetical protein NC417_07590 [Candidatus Gastranaerophilales bacterium]|nr:hypothetical protein [Candidatus Gastranaerophilales bacterium]